MSFSGWNDIFSGLIQVVYSLSSKSEVMSEMGLSRREFLNIVGYLVGGWVLSMHKGNSTRDIARILLNMNKSGELQGVAEEQLSHELTGNLDCRLVNSSTMTDWEKEICQEVATRNPQSESPLETIGEFSAINPRDFTFDEDKYALQKRQLERKDWGRNNRHLPILIDPRIINKPGERNPQALKMVVAYTPFNNPRYVAGPGERVSMCNIAAWDWSRALQVHLPHWIGDTEMSANMLYRWISHPQAGGIFGEGWQPVSQIGAQLLANLGIPVFALVENTKPGRHGHVALVYPEDPKSKNDEMSDGPYFASIVNGRSRGGNGIKDFRSAFRRLTPTYFVHKHDFIVFQDS
jgi:hypothetical protein